MASTLMIRVVSYGADGILTDKSFKMIAGRDKAGGDKGGV